MKILSLVVLIDENNKSKIITQASDLSSIGFFQRSTVREFMTFFTKTIADRIQRGQRVSVKEQDHIIHIYKKENGIIGAVISDDEYPSRVAFGIIDKMINEIMEKYTINDIVLKGEVSYSNIDEYIQKYQNPANADKITLLQNELNETKDILDKTIEQVLNRGEKLDDLIEKSNDLAKQSKDFYGKTKKMNSCCVLI